MSESEQCRSMSESDKGEENHKVNHIGCENFLNMILDSNILIIDNIVRAMRADSWYYIRRKYL